MRRFYTITANSFMELVRQPVCLLLTSSSAVFMVFLACVPYFGLGEDPRMVKDSVLAVMFVTGLLGAVLSAASSVAHEIRTGTALAVLSKPVGRLQFLLAKYFGVAAALTLMTYVNMVAALTASRMAYDAYGSTDRLALSIFAGAVVLAYAIGGFNNYFLRRQFVADAIISLAILVTLAFLVINNTSGHLASLGEEAHVDWRLVPASVLILFALWMAAGLAVACSTRLEMIPTLAVVTGFFMLGILSPWLAGKLAEAGTWWASAFSHAFSALVPNWQLFWMADTLEKGKPGVPLSYLVRALGYTAGYLGAVLVAALLLFEDRELS